MLTLAVEVREIIVTGDVKEMKTLKSIMTIPTESYAGGRKSTVYQSFLTMNTNGTAKFATGLLKLVTSQLKKHGIEHVVDERKLLAYGPPKGEKPHARMLHGIELRDYQLEAIESASGWNRKPTLGPVSGIIRAAVNAGKTEIAAGIVKAIGRPTLMISSKIALLAQTRDRMELRLGQKVGFIGDGKWDCENTSCIVASPQTLWARLKSAKTKNETLKFLQQFQVIIHDESHHSGSDTWLKINQAVPAPWTILMSGTPLHGDDATRLKIISAAGKPIVQISMQELVHRGISAKPIITMHSIPVPNLPRGTLYVHAYKQAVVYNNSLHVKMVKIGMQAAAEKKPCLMLVRQLEHGEAVYAMLANQGISCEFISGQNDLKEVQDGLNRLASGELSVLVSTTILQEGIDVPNIRVLVNAIGGESIVTTLQILGRGMRQKAVNNILEHHDFWFKGHRWFDSHSKTRHDYYVSEGFIPKVV